MTNLAGINQLPQLQSNSVNQNIKPIILEEIDEIYFTRQGETERSDFNSTFDVLDTNKENHDSSLNQGELFLDSLVENKEELIKDLGVTEDEYNSMACIALALASQETGMGQEEGYSRENNDGLNKFLRDSAIKIFGKHSASSGLTQLKIYDFINSGQFSTRECKLLKEKYGIQVDSKTDDNLYEDPSKSAVATMFALKSILGHYDSYIKNTDSEHFQLTRNLQEQGIDPKEFEQEGTELLMDLYEVYNNADNEDKIEFRNNIQDLILAKNNSKKEGMWFLKDKEYNEEYQLENLQEKLEQMGSDIELPDNTMDLLRYVLTSPGYELEMVEYSAYAWNKGTGTTGMQIDRCIADKLSIIMSDPESYDYDSFTSNVVLLSKKYAEQTVGSDAFEALNNPLKKGGFTTH